MRQHCIFSTHFRELAGAVLSGKRETPMPLVSGHAVYSGACFVTPRPSFDRTRATLALLVECARDLFEERFTQDGLDTLLARWKL